MGASTGGVKGASLPLGGFRRGRGRRPYAETPGSRFSRGQPRAHLGMGIARNPMRPFCRGRVETAEPLQEQAMEARFRS